MQSSEYTSRGNSHHPVFVWIEDFQMSQQERKDEDTIRTFHYTPASDTEDVPTDVKCIEISSLVTEIPDRAFDAFSNLQEIRFSHSSIEDGVEHKSLLRTIGNCAFLNCVSLTEIVIPNTVEQIGDSTFQGCIHMSSVHLSLQLKQLGAEAFLSCTSLISVKLPDSLIQMGSSVFQHCSQLTNVKLPNALEEIPFAAFQFCSSLQEITIPASVKTIASNAFSDCYALLELSLCEGLRSIQAYAFRHCRSLEKIRIPGTVLKIGRSAFSECSSLQTVEFANGNLQVLNGLAFADCKKLLHLALPASIHKLYPNTFAGCTLLRSLSERSVANLMGASLRTRFDGLPVHDLCYLQVHRPLEETIQALQSLDQESFDVSKYSDFVRMTPFHILALSSRPDPLLFEALLSKYPHHLWNHRDVLKTTAMSYLLGNRALESSTAIQHVVNSALQDRMNSLGLDKWRILLQDSIHAVASARVPDRPLLFKLMVQKLQLLEQKENLSNLEQAVWKMKISQTTLHETNDMESNGLLRESCRISCGAEIVIPNVLSYMDEQGSEIFGI